MNLKRSMFFLLVGGSHVGGAHKKRLKTKRVGWMDMNLSPLSLLFSS